MKKRNKTNDALEKLLKALAEIDEPTKPEPTQPEDEDMIDKFKSLKDIIQKCVDDSTKYKVWGLSIGEHISEMLAANLPKHYYMTRKEPAEPELKPCPFCGNSATTHDTGCDTGHYITCGKCYVRVGNFDTKETAIESWNKRV